MAVSKSLTEKKFSSPSGKPTSLAGNGMVWTWIEAFLSFFETRPAFDGVVMMVTFSPRAAKRLAISAQGIMWPGERKGRT